MWAEFEATPVFQFQFLRPTYLRGCTETIVPIQPHCLSKHSSYDYSREQLKNEKTVYYDVYKPILANRLLKPLKQITNQKKSNPMKNTLYLYNSSERKKVHKKGK